MQEEGVEGKYRKWEDEYTEYLESNGKGGRLYVERGGIVCRKRGK